MADYVFVRSRMMSMAAVSVIMARHVNDFGLHIVTTDEGDRHQTYLDIRGIPTIGYGHTGPDVHMGLVWTEDQALAALRTDLARFEIAVNNATHDVPTGNNQFSAMVSLTYNIGEEGFKTSHVLANHRAGNYDGAALSFMSWDKSHVNGQLVEVAGLKRRRQEESDLYRLADTAPGTPPVAVQEPPADHQVTDDQIQHQHEQFKLMQAALASMGYYAGKIDGMWGPQSIEALGKFTALLA